MEPADLCAERECQIFMLAQCPREEQIMFPADHVLGAQRNGLNHVGMNMGAFDRETRHAQASPCA